MYGWAGQILRVDLTAGTVIKEPLDPAFARVFLGGRGFNSKILYDEFDPAIIDPYDPDNVICIGSGPLSGTLAPGSNCITISVARSPLTGFFSDDNAGGRFGPELGYAGYDAIVVKGCSEKPVYLHIHNDIVELRDASHVWDKDVWETSDDLREEVGDSAARVFAVGPAGESAGATALAMCSPQWVSSDSDSSMVMASKHLKAITVRGTGGVKIAHPEEFMKACEESCNRQLQPPLYSSWPTYGVLVCNRQGNVDAGTETQDDPTFAPHLYYGGGLATGTSTRGADRLRGWPTLEVFADRYQDRRDDIIADLDVPPPIVDKWLRLGALDGTKYEGKAHIVEYYQDQSAVANAVGLCEFIASWQRGIGPRRMALLLSTATGVVYDWQSILECGERIHTLEYALQRRYGFRRRDDCPAGRFFEETLLTDAVLDRDKYDVMLDEYYELRGYDREGRPSRERLEALRLEDVADDLEQRGSLGWGGATKVVEV